MAAKKENLSNCFLCGAEYEVCKMCEKIKHYTPWRAECDSSRHWQIYTIVKDFRAGILKAGEAKEQLDHLKVTLDEVKTFVSSVQDTLLPLFKEEEPVEAKAVVEEPTKVKSQKTNFKSAKTERKEK